MRSSKIKGIANTALLVIGAAACTVGSSEHAFSANEPHSNDYIRDVMEYMENCNFDEKFEIIGKAVSVGDTYRIIVEHTEEGKTTIDFNQVTYIITDTGRGILDCRTGTTVME